jgi:hypothetical protein
MATYYKFAEREADSFVNWAEIGKGLTDMLQEQVKIREDKRTAIDKVTRENLKSLSEAPTGDHTNLNTWTLDYADNARQAILLQDRLLKSGALKLKDYTIMRQNLNDGTDELFSVIKNFQTAFKDKRDRMISNDPANKSQAFEMDLMAYTEQFGNFSKSKAMIDPNNFMVNIGIMEPDPENQGVMKVGKMIAPSGFLKKIQNTKVDYFDSNGAAEAASKSFGGFTESTIQSLNRLQGKVVTIDDVRKRPGYEEALNEEINSFFSNPFNITSVLTNDLVKDKNGKAYVSNISGKEGNVIEYVFDPQTNFYKPNLTAEQEQAARDYMRRKIESRLDIKLKEDPFNKPQPEAGRGATATTPSGGNIEAMKQGVKNELVKNAAQIQQESGKLAFAYNDAIGTAESLGQVFSSSPSTAGKYIFKTKESHPDDVKNGNLMVVTDNNNNLVTSYDLIKVPTSIAGREKLLADLASKLIDYDFEKQFPGSYLSTGGQQSGTSLPSR